jgi:phosphoribosylpyrophosphate synthetase/non-canonical (house-cleaning) NTP pyrophosphatase
MKYHALDGPRSTLARRLAEFEDVTYYTCSFGKFSDGSDNIEVGGFCNGINEHAGKDVVFVMTHGNNDVVMQCLHVITMLLESQVGSLTVVSPFEPTATMERVLKEGVVATANTTAKILSGLPSCGRPVRYLLYDLHTLQQRFYYCGTAVAELHTTVDATCHGLHGQFDMAFFPDDGAFKRFGPVLANAGLWTGRVGTCAKVRRGDDRVITVQGDHDVCGKRILLIDDLVRTGGTLLQSAKALRDLGAAGVSAFCVHAAGSVAELQRLEAAGALDALYLTDTVEATVSSLGSSGPRPFFHVASVAPLVYSDLMRLPRTLPLEHVFAATTTSGDGQGAVQCAAQGGGQGAAEGAGQGAAQGAAQATVQGAAEGTAQGAGQGAAEGTAQGAGQGAAEGAVQGVAQGAAEGVGAAQGAVATVTQDVQDVVQSEATDAAYWARKGSVDDVRLDNVLDGLFTILADTDHPVLGDDADAVITELRAREAKAVAQEDDDVVEWTDLSTRIARNFDDFARSAKYDAANEAHQRVHQVLTCLAPGQSDAIGPRIGQQAHIGQQAQDTDGQKACTGQQAQDTGGQQACTDQQATTGQEAPVNEQGVRAKCIVLLCSESPIKKQAVRAAMDQLGYEVVLRTLACASGVSEQPLTWQETVTGCTNRLEQGLCSAANAVDFCVAVENGIDERSGDDVAYVLAADRHGNRAHAASTSVHMPEEAVQAARASASSASVSGASVPMRTCAHYLLAGVWNRGKNTADPQQYLCGVSRAEILAQAVRVALGQLPRR